MAAVRMHELTSPEVGKLAADGAVAVVPLGAMEQHGPQLPLQTDYYLANEVAERAAIEASEKGARVLVTPPVWAGFSPHHMQFPGTISLRADTLLSVVSDVCDSLWQHGFRRILVLNGHGGNANLLGAAAQTLRFERGVRVGVASYWSFALEELAEWRQSEVGGINHACEMELSLMLDIRPELCHQDAARDSGRRITAPYFGADLLVGGPVSTAWDFAELSDDGTIGAPELASGDRGKELLAIIVSKVADFMVEMASWNWDDPASVARGSHE